jgi:hypothetical protein
VQGVLRGDADRAVQLMGDPGGGGGGQARAHLRNRDRLQRPQARPQQGQRSLHRGASGQRLGGQQRELLLDRLELRQLTPELAPLAAVAGRQVQHALGRGRDLARAGQGPGAVQLVPDSAVGGGHRGRPRAIDEHGIARLASQVGARDDLRRGRVDEAGSQAGTGIPVIGHDEQGGRPAGERHSLGADQEPPVAQRARRRYRNEQAGRGGQPGQLQDVRGDDAGIGGGQPGGQPPRRRR